MQQRVNVGQYGARVGRFAEGIARPFQTGAEGTDDGGSSGQGRGRAGDDGGLRHGGACCVVRWVA